MMSLNGVMLVKNQCQMGKISSSDPKEEKVDLISYLFYATFSLLLIDSL